MSDEYIVNDEGRYVQDLIRCKDCKNTFINTFDGVRRCKKRKFMFRRNADDFCSDAERSNHDSTNS